MGQLNGAVGQVGTFLRATANPIQLVHVSQGGRSWILSAQVQAYALALALAFVAVLLGAGAIVAEREENVLGRLVGGLVGLRPAGRGEDRVRDADRGRARAAARARVRPRSSSSGTSRAASRGSACRSSSPGSCSRRRRSAPSESSSARSRARRGRRRSSRSSSRCRSRSSRSSRTGRRPSVAWIGALFPFGHAVHAFTVALYDTHPAGLFLRECVWLARARARLRPRGPGGGAAAALSRRARAPAEPARTVQAEVTWPRSESCGPSPRSSSACGAPARPS